MCCVQREALSGGIIKLSRRLGSPSVHAYSARGNVGATNGGSQPTTELRLLPHSVIVLDLVSSNFVSGPISETQLRYGVASQPRPIAEN